MGSSDSDGAGLGDGGAGSIVWVRRRNGSWWPGKILGPDELSASHLMSPRSGTPVKLLGREDASVDWYNLEKSKRVKPFRCGEFDDCIERAEASMGLPAKKREKYARREDAILHALELEKQYLEKKYGTLVPPNSMRENSSDSEKKNLVTPSGALENGNGKLGNHEFYQLDKKVGVSNVMERNDIPLHSHAARDGTHPGLDEHNNQSRCRIRGIQDFGLRAVPINRMIHISAASDDSNRMAIDGPNDPCFGNSSDSDYRNSIGKGKRLLEGFVEESFPKRHDRHHAVVKVMQNSAELPSCSLQRDGDFVSMYEKELTGDVVHRSMYFSAQSHEIYETNQSPRGRMKIPVSQLEVDNCRPQHGVSVEETTSGSSEETESDSSETHSQEPYAEAGMMLSDAETLTRVKPRTIDIFERQGGQESTSSEESGELSLDDRSISHLHHPNHSGVGVSKWQLKGKRNVRNFSKRNVDRVANSTYLEGRDGSLSQRAPSHSLSYYHDNDYTNDIDFIEEYFDPTTQFSKRAFFPSQGATRRQTLSGQNMIDWEELTWGRPFRGFWDPSFVGRNGHDMLIDVDLKVQANRQGEHVPWVSLMSRLNGKAIIGHPIQIEALEDGSTDVLLSTSGVYDNQSYEIDDRNRVPPVWTTARRTANVRVPRPHPSSQLDGDEYAHNKYVHQSGKERFKKTRVPKTHTRAPKSPLQGMKKPPRKVNPKTKTLSSISYDHKFSNKRRENDTSNYMDGVIKSVDSGPPAVACIPVKLVFSRLLEAVGR